MRGLHFILVVILLFSCDNHVGQNNTDTELFRNFNSEKFFSSIEKEAGIILDVRTEEEIALGMIEGASHIDFYDDNFETKISKIQKDKVIYVYCRSGGRSSKAAKLLAQKGYKDVVNLQGGILSWVKSGFSLTNIDYNKDENIEEINMAHFNLVLSDNRIVLANFHTKWCVPCRKILPVMNELEQQYLNRVFISKIDIDNSLALSNQYEVDAVPTLILFKDSEEIWRHVGLISKEDLVKLLDESL